MSKDLAPEFPLPQLKTKIWIDALIRRAEVGGAFACLVCRGDADAGSVLVLVRQGRAQTLYQPERDFDGNRVWRGQDMTDEILNQTLKSRLDFDPDLNLVEIEDKEGRNFIEEPVLSEPDQASDQAVEAGAVAAARALFRDR